ncbi:unnamed protein product [Durusdinium trenchii]|uniref:Secreted protein n=1 Tax=Durusdinium trenchii TaxID=1381693 RepID=A0ABP0PWI4_9DINO
MIRCWHRWLFFLALSMAERCEEDSSLLQTRSDGALQSGQRPCEAELRPCMFKLCMPNDVQTRREKKRQKGNLDPSNFELTPDIYILKNHLFRTCGSLRQCYANGVQCPGLFPRSDSSTVTFNMTSLCVHAFGL